MPTQDEWKNIRKWTRAKYTELRNDEHRRWNGHPSHAAAEAIRLAGEHFNLGHGSEGFCDQSNGRHGITYLTMGDTYDTTIVFRSESERFEVSDIGTIIEAAPKGRYD